MISRALERWKAENPAKVERITCEVQARCLAARLERQLDSTALRLEDEACHSAGEASLFVSTDVETGELQLKEKNGMLQKGMLPAGESFRNAVDAEDEEAQLIDSAIEKALASSAESVDPLLIQENCRTEDSSYIDSNFSGDTAIFLNPSYQKPSRRVECWLRPFEFYKSPLLVEGDARPEEIRQGNLGDCWLPSAMSVLAQRPEQVAKLLAVKEYNVKGVCH
jgi:hypothetical protein